MNRRAFLSLLGRVTAAGLVLPYEPQRVYSFLTSNPLATETRILFERFELPTMGLAEGVTPHGLQLTAQRVTMTVEQWGAYEADAMRDLQFASRITAGQMARWTPTERD